MPPFWIVAQLGEKEGYQAPLGEKMGNPAEGGLQKKKGQVVVSQGRAQEQPVG